MATNISRVISSCRNNPELGHLLTSCDKKFSSYRFGTNMPIPNQCLKTATKKNGQPVKLCINKNAGLILDMIRNLAQEKSTYRLENNKKDTPIEFVCMGYLNKSGNIVIDNIVIPSLQELCDNSQDIEDAKEKLFKYVAKKEANIDLLCTYFDYMRDNVYPAKEKFGLMPIALLGTTKPLVSYNDQTENCPRLGEIAKSVVPGDAEFRTPFVSGLLCVTPKTIKQTPNGQELQDGSLECIVTTYEKLKNNYVKPNNMLNIVSCERITPQDTIAIVPISCSHQPLENLPRITGSHQKY